MYYKIVRNTDKGLCSAIIRDCNAPNYELIYNTDAWTRPIAGTGGVYVFNSLVSVEIFLLCNRIVNYEVWECSVKNPRRFTKISTYMDNADIKCFWSRYNNIKNKHKSLRDLLGKNSPSGSYIASAVKLVKRIDV